MESIHEFDSFFNKAQQIVDDGLNELLEVKIIRENDPSDFSYIQHQLNELIEEGEQLILKFPNKQREIKHVQQKIKEIQDVMVKGIL